VEKTILFNVSVIITRKRGTRDIHARDEMPGLGKIRMSKSVDKREKKIHE
jgi:hypothetical protein